MASPTPAISPATSLVGVVDIGSNSIRLVIYRAGGKLPHPQFNEREVCSLAEGVAQYGKLDEGRMAHAFKVLKRFARIIALSRVSQTHAFATEAVRRANNASAFIQEAEGILGQEVEVISGVNEARLAGQGVAGGFLAPKGIVADLGGGSLELIPIDKTPMNQYAVSLPMGYLIALSPAELNDYLAEVAWLGDETLAKGVPLYAVGGAWRAVATAYCSRHKPRIDIAHGLVLDMTQMQDMLSRIARKQGEVRGIPPARRETMAQVIRISEVVLARLSPSQVIFSSYGVREGVLLSHTNTASANVDVKADAATTSDPLMDGVREYAEVGWRFAGLGQQLETLLPPFLTHLDEATQRLAYAVAYLVDVAWLEHPDHRPRLALEKMLGLAVVGITHAERVWMAAVLYTRYMGRMPKKKSFLSLLPKHGRKSARYVGLLLRMFMTISGGVAPVFEGMSVATETLGGNGGKIKPEKKGEGKSTGLAIRVHIEGDILGSGVLFERRLAEVNRCYPGVIRLGRG